MSGLNRSRLFFQNTALRAHTFSRLGDKNINLLAIWKSVWMNECNLHICTWEIGKTGSNTSISKVCRADGSSWKTENQRLLNTMTAPGPKRVFPHVRECPCHQVCPRCAAVSPGQDLAMCGWFGSTAGGIRRQADEPGARAVQRERETLSRQRIGLSRIGCWRYLSSPM